MRLWFGRRRGAFRVRDEGGHALRHKEACDKPNEQGYRCTFEVQVASANIGASMYNNIPFAVFYKDKDRGGQWNMRPPF